MLHVVSSCAQTKLEGELQQLYSADDVTDGTWLMSTRQQQEQLLNVNTHANRRWSGTKQYDYWD